MRGTLFWKVSFCEKQWFHKRERMAVFLLRDRCSLRSTVAPLSWLEACVRQFSASLCISHSLRTHRISPLQCCLLCSFQERRNESSIIWLSNLPCTIFCQCKCNNQLVNIFIYCVKELIEVFRLFRRTHLSIDRRQIKPSKPQLERIA